jgi:hypothetical protein
MKMLIWPTVSLCIGIPVSTGNPSIYVSLEKKQYQICINFKIMLIHSLAGRGEKFHFPPCCWTEKRGSSSHHRGTVMFYI